MRHAIWSTSRYCYACQFENQRIFDQYQINKGKPDNLDYCMLTEWTNTQFVFKQIEKETNGPNVLWSRTNAYGYANIESGSIMIRNKNPTQNIRIYDILGHFDGIIESIYEQQFDSIRFGIDESTGMWIEKYAKFKSNNHNHWNLLMIAEFSIEIPTPKLAPKSLFQAELRLDAWHISIAMLIKTKLSKRKFHKFSLFEDRCVSMNANLCSQHSFDFKPE